MRAVLAAVALVLAIAVGVSALRGSPDGPCKWPDRVARSGEVVGATRGEGELVPASVAVQPISPPGAARLQNAHGCYRFFDLPAGRYRIDVDIAAYRGESREVDVVRGRRSVADFDLEKES